MSSFVQETTLTIKILLEFSFLFDMCHLNLLFITAIKTVLFTYVFKSK